MQPLGTLVNPAPRSPRAVYCFLCVCSQEREGEVLPGELRRRTSLDLKQFTDRVGHPGWLNSFGRFRLLSASNGEKVGPEMSPVSRSHTLAWCLHPVVSTLNIGGWTLTSNLPTPILSVKGVRGLGKHVLFYCYIPP